MPKTIYIHIGLPKTATSHIQTTLQCNQSVLHGRGRPYIQAGPPTQFNDNGKHKLAISLMETRWAEIQLRIERSEIDGVWEAVRQEIEASHAEGFIASSEWFAFDVHTTDQIERIRRELAGYRVAIVVVLRDVVDYVNSAYAQSVRDGYAGFVSSYIDEAWHSLNWGALVARWAAVFGADQLIALRFEEMQARGIVPSLLSSIVTGALPLGESRARNKSLPAEATMMLRSVNASSIDDDEKIAFRDVVKAFFERHPGEFPPGTYVGEAAARLLRRNCVWPHLVSVGTPEKRGEV